MSNEFAYILVNMNITSIAANLDLGHSFTGFVCQGTVGTWNSCAVFVLSDYRGDFVAVFSFKGRVRGMGVVYGLSFFS